MSAEAVETGAADAVEVDAPPRAPSPSPSRASDFLTCPLLYRFRTIDRLPEQPSPAATRGTVVHSVLERLSTSRRPSARPTGRLRCCNPSGSACSRRSPSSPRCSTTSRPAPSGCTAADGLPRRLLRARGPAPARAGRARAVRRARRWSPGCGCAATSTGSMSRRRATCGWSTTRPAGHRARASRPRRCSRCASTRWCCGDCTARFPGCSSCSTSAAARCFATSPTRPTCGHRAQAARRSGRPSSAPPSATTGGPARAGSATGATTRTCARPSAARRRRCRCCPSPDRPAGPGGRRAALPAHAGRRGLSRARP